MRRDTDYKIEKLLGFSIRVLCDDGIERNVEFTDFIAKRNEHFSINIDKKQPLVAYLPDTYKFDFSLECDGYTANETVFESK